MDPNDRSAATPAPEPPPSEPPPADEAPPPEVIAAARFFQTIHTLTPASHVTTALIALNVAVFVAMAAIGRVGLFEPTVGDLIRWGASYAPRTTAGEWWRLLTATFIHIGVVHLLVNMYALAGSGPLVERLFGNGPFLVLYVVAGLAGALASVVVNPMTVSAGASGAIFGVFGALLAFVVRRRDAIPPAILQRLKKSAFLFVAVNLAFGFAKSGIDNSAHIGVLAAGFLCGLALAGELTPEAAARRWRRAGVVAAAGALALGLVASRLEPTPDIEGELDRSIAVESRAVDRFNALVHDDKVDDAATAAVIGTEILPPWRESRLRLEALRPRLPAAVVAGFERRLRYMHLREEAWTLHAEAAREHDVAKLERAEAKAAEAEKLVEEMNRESN